MGSTRDDLDRKRPDDNQDGRVGINVCYKTHRGCLLAMESMLDSKTTEFQTTTRSSVETTASQAEIAREMRRRILAAILSDADQNASSYIEDYDGGRGGE